MTKILIIGAGGFAGAILRYLTSVFITAVFTKPFIPLGTLTVNIIGSFIMGAGNGFIMFHANIPENLRFFLLVGLLGAFTTYSTFSMEAFFLFNENNPAAMFLYIFIHLLLGIGAAAAGYYLMKVI